MRTIGHRLLIACLVLPSAACFGQSPPGVEEKAPTTTGLVETQVTITAAREGHKTRFRGTVITKATDQFALLTGGHCLSSDDEGQTVQIGQKGESFTAHVVRVVRNPAYSMPRGDLGWGTDSAIVALRVEPEVAETGAFRAVRAAELSPRPVPHPDGQAVTVHAIDQFDKEYTMRAGNFSNPRWLEWGQAYCPIAGDSGAGVFLMRSGPDGKPAPILIGNVTGGGSRGGGACLVFRGTRWIDAALKSAAAPPKDR